MSVHASVCVLLACRTNDNNTSTSVKVVTLYHDLEDVSFCNLQEDLLPIVLVSFSVILFPGPLDEYHRHHIFV